MYVGKKVGLWSRVSGKQGSGESDRDPGEVVLSSEEPGNVQ